ncbi:MAG: tetratricopeptide repeat protein [Opitutaceae bacterium]|nr:tetratricopeptide repeat protein [Opitutaceae bacterium]
MSRISRTLVAGLIAGGAIALVAGWPRAVSSAAAPAPAALRLGQVEFPTSGLPAAQPHFLRGVAALHSFWYAEALESFEAALRLDPGFAMAWWGVAMTYRRPFVPGTDLEAGRRALANIRETMTLTARERAYIDALRAWFAGATPAERAQAHAVAMRDLHRAYPDDLDAGAFHALALLGQDWPDENTLARHRAAGEIAGAVFRRNPQHPGAAHYIIHSYDEPELAAEGLAAARHYATIAPDAAHAQHMPSHIFVHLGMWPEATAANEAAWAASEAWVRRKGLGPAHRDYHNLHWLIYSCLQEGRYGRAARLVDEFQELRKEMPPELLFFFQRSVAAFVVDTNGWERAEALFSAPSASVASAAVTVGLKAPAGIELCGVDAVRPPPAGGAGLPPADIPAFIRTLAAATLGAADLDERLRQLRASAGGDAAMPEFWRIRILEIMAVTSARQGRFDDAIVALREATAIEVELGIPPGPPAAYKPPHELFGEILLRAGRPAEAAAQFGICLRRHPNRARSVLGEARARAASGDRPGALDSYRRLLQLWVNADADLAELREAREFVRSGHG